MHKKGVNEADKKPRVNVTVTNNLLIFEEIPFHFLTMPFFTNILFPTYSGTEIGTDNGIYTLELLPETTIRSHKNGMTSFFLFHQRNCDEFVVGYCIPPLGLLLTRTE